MFSVSAVLYVVAVILFVVSAFPSVPHNWTLGALGLAFLAAGHVAGS